jgi:hypothetical protein
MNPVSQFLDEVEKQWSFLWGVGEYDQYCKSCYVGEKRIGRFVDGYQRRGWTRRDKIMAKYLESSMMSLPRVGQERSTPPTVPKRMTTRLDMLLARIDYQSIATRQANKAIAYADSIEGFSRIICDSVSLMLASHIEWLEYMKCEQPSDIKSRWENNKGRLEVITQMLNELVAVSPEPLREIEREIPDRCKPIWKILVRMSSQKLPSFFEDIRLELSNQNIEYPINTIEKYIRVIKNICILHSVEVDTFERGSKKILIKI